MIRGIIIFAVAAVLIQAAAILFMTPRGLAALYPYVLLWESEKITTGDAGLGEYFPLHSDVEDAGLIILAIDTNVSDSYKLAGDYLQFLGRFTHISSVALYTSRTRVIGISDASVDGDYEAFVNSCNAQKKSGILPDQMYNFAEKIYTLNSRLSPDMKFTVNGILGQDDIKDVISSLTADLYMAPGGFSGDHIEVTEAKTEEEFVALFEKHYNIIEEILGQKFQRHAERYSYVAEGTLEESSAVQILEKYSPPGDGAVFALLPEHLCAEGSPFITKAEEVYGKVIVTRTEYYNCTTLDGKEEVPRNDGSFPLFVSGIRIASAGALADFRNYFGRIANTFASDELDDRMSMIGEAGKNTFFVISGSGPVTFGADEDKPITGTVNVAPG